MNELTIPEWYENSDLDNVTCPPRASRRAGAPVRRALAAIGEAMTKFLIDSPCVGSWLGAVEPRLKVAGVFLLVIACTLLHSLWSLGAMFAMAVTLALSIGLPVKRLLGVWLGAPLFSLAIIIPAATNLVTPGDAVLRIWDFGGSVHLGPWVLPHAIIVTDSGLTVAARFLLRSLDCITLSYLLIASTDSMVLLNGLRRLGMPKVFGMVLTMTQRYLAVMLRVAEEIHLAKLSRTISAGPLRNEQKWVAAGIGMLFRRTQKLAGEVQNAMISRGYDGDLQIRLRAAIKASDVMWLICSLAFAFVLYVFDKR
ncbi:MAG: cobalt ECF transporter T component CbiQ [Armatimonadetes bacterium]|nr:cobalt ECF transporter T component CbiQ [Armatimonadota bacterium]